MEARELRICNWVQYDGIPYQATASTIRLCEDDRGIFGKPNPIPLTEEWLLRFGFEKTENNWMVLDWIVLKFSWESLAGLVFVLDNESIYLSHIKHVHQLQNLIFALTGEEVTIKKS